MVERKILKEFSDLLDRNLIEEAFHKCTCGIHLTKKESKFVGRQDFDENMRAAWFRCPNCNTSFLKQEMK